MSGGDKVAVPKTFPELAINIASKKFAEFVNLSEMPVVWNANMFHAIQQNAVKEKLYPIGVMRVMTIARNENVPQKRNLMVQEYGAIHNGNTRPAIRLMPITVTLGFKLITDDYRQAMFWATHLLTAREDKASYTKLAFSIESTKYPSIRIANQMILMSDSYDIQEVEYTEDRPMEYIIEGQIILNTRTSPSLTQVDLLAIFDVYDQMDASNAVKNVDGSTSPLISNSGRSLPIRLRSNIEGNL